MEPASTIIAKLGGNAVVAEITGVHPTRVANWKRAKSTGGTGGTIPFRHVPKLLDAAQRKSIPLTAGDFLPASELSRVAS